MRPQGNVASCSSDLDTCFTLLGGAISPASMKAWDHLTVDGKNSCAGPKLRGATYGFEHAWFIDGDLATYWEDHIVGQVDRLKADSSTKLYGTSDRNTHARYEINYEIYLLGENENIGKARPTLVLLCEKLKYAEQFRKILGKNSAFRRFGIDVISQEDDTQPVAGSPSASSSFSNFAGHPIFFTDLTPPNDPNFSRGSLGGVLRLGTTGYWGLTAAHSWLAHYEEINGLVKPSGLSVYFVETKVEESELIQRRIYVEDFASTLSNIKYIGGWDYTDVYLSPKFNKKHDWLLFRISDPRLMNNENAMVLEDGHRLVARPKAKAHWPLAGRAIFSGGSSGTRQGSISKTSFYRKFPWTEDRVRCYAIDCDSKIGDSGSWALDPDTGDILGIVTAYNRQSRLTYVIPAEHVFDDIQSLWSGTTPSVGSMFATRDEDWSRVAELWSDVNLRSRESETSDALPSQIPRLRESTVTQANVSSSGPPVARSQTSYITPSFQDPIFSQRSQSPSSGISHFESGQQISSTSVLPPQEVRLLDLQDEVASSFVSIELRNYPECQQFMHHFPEILKFDLSKFQTAAVRAWQQGRQDLANKCIERQAFLEGYAEFKEEYFSKLENGDEEVVVELLQREGILRSQVEYRAADALFNQDNET